METGQEHTVVLIKRLQNGDEKAREELIKNHNRFIKNIARKYTYEKENIMQSEAYSVALIAFNEAADCYKEDKGARFTSFAAQIIKRRLIDMLRSNSKYSPEISFEEVYKDSPLEEELIKEQEEDLSEDIEWFKETLGEYGITLDDLVRETPGHKDTRCRTIKMAREIIDEPDLYKQLKNKKKLPFKSLLLKFRCNPKTIQRHRKYIIAVCIALSGESPYLKDYVLNIEKGCEGYGL